MKLANEISKRIANQTHERIPSFCAEFDIPVPTKVDGSKRVKADEIVSALSEGELAHIAIKIAQQEGDILLDELGREVLERSQPRLNKITRRDIARCLDQFGGLQGEASIVEIVKKYWPLRSFSDLLDSFSRNSTDQSIEAQIVRHMVRNNDWSVDQLFERIEAYTWSNARFFALLESALHPLARRGGKQTELAAALTPLLARDGYRLDVAEEHSGFPVYKVVQSGGVFGKPKNLIFASNGPKPIIGFADAINNDIKILEHEANCLIYEDQIPSDGILWCELVRWWQALHGYSDGAEARQSLGLRLQESLSSEGEKAVFRTYFQVFHPTLKDRLPALIPQVYLHYDPAVVKTLRHRGSFARQRMDFLLLLGNRSRVVVEVDGTQHFSTDNEPSLTQYAAMMSADRDLRLLGYEVYRFGANEVVGPNSNRLIGEFFDRLFRKHGVT